MLLAGHTQIDCISLNGNESNRSKSLLGFILDNDLMFDAHIKSLCREAARKLSALCRISKYLSYDQKLLLVNSVLRSQFTCCPLIWMFSSRNSE